MMVNKEHLNETGLKRIKFLAKLVNAKTKLNS
jgi:hypothetical protein